MLGGVTLGLMPVSEQWSVQAFVQNITDKEYFAQRTRRQSEIISSAADGRRYGVRFNYSF